MAFIKVIRCAERLVSLMLLPPRTTAMLNHEKERSG